MKKRLLLVVAAAFASILLSKAQEVMLKDGTIYSGYVSEQLTSGQVCITYSNARYVVPGDSLHISYGSDEKVTLRWGDRYYDDVDIWEEGDLVSFTTYSPGSVYVSATDLQSIRFPYNELVHDVVVAGKTYEGNITEIVVGKYTKMLVDGKVVVLAQKNITSQTKVSINREKSLNINMFPYLDIYEMQNFPTLTGALISQNYMDGSAIFLTKEGALMPIIVGKITAIRKMPNDLYDELAAVEEDTVEVRINGEEAQWLSVHVDKRGEVSFPLKELTGSLMMAWDQTIVVSVKKDLPQALVLLPFDPFSSRSETFNLGKREDWTLKVIRPSSTAMEGDREVKEYNQASPGFYLLYNPIEKAIAPIWAN